VIARESPAPGLFQPGGCPAGPVWTAGGPAGAATRLPRGWGRSPTTPPISAPPIAAPAIAPPPPPASAAIPAPAPAPIRVPRTAFGLFSTVSIMFAHEDSTSAKITSGASAVAVRRPISPPVGGRRLVARRLG